jgi:hypothetical protein
VASKLLMLLTPAAPTRELSGSKGANDQPRATGPAARSSLVRTLQNASATPASAWSVPLRLIDTSTAVAVDESSGLAGADGATMRQLTRGSAKLSLAAAGANRCDRLVREPSHRTLRRASKAAEHSETGNRTNACAGFAAMW